MSAPRRESAKSPIRRICIRCNHPIADQRPLFLVGDTSGRVVGPFHAGCAERLVLQARKDKTTEGFELMGQLGMWPSRREEELPS